MHNKEVKFMIDGMTVIILFINYLKDNLGCNVIKLRRQVYY
jgi:hypothetical protein